MNQDKVAIIGAGPAGIACATQLKRYGIDFLLFEKKQVGGLLRNANLVENYLGFESGVSGKELVRKFRRNLEILGIEPIHEEVMNVRLSDGIFNIETNNSAYNADILVIASGTKPRQIPAHIKNFEEKEIIYEIADMENTSFINKSISIIGAGDAAFDYAINLVNNYNVKEVFILNRSNTVKCIPILEKRVLDTEKVKHIKNIRVKSIEKIQEQFVLSCENGNESQLLSADYLICAIGREKHVDFLGSSILKTNNQSKLYFIGDVSNGSCRQTLIAAGEGIKAAMEIALNKN